MSLIDVIDTICRRLIDVRDMIYRRFDEKIFKECAEAAKEIIKEILDIIKKRGGEITLDELLEEFNKKIDEAKKRKIMPNADYIEIEIGPFKIRFKRCRV